MTTAQSVCTRTQYDLYAQSSLKYVCEDSHRRDQKKSERFMAPGRLLPLFSYPVFVDNVDDQPLGKNYDE